MAEKVTIMVLKADLQCHCCYKKVKKTLCKFPQIRDQVYDEKSNTVMIKVVCCSPEKIRDKLCSKGGKTIKSIEIKEAGKPKEPEKKKEPEKPKEAEKPKQPEKPKVVTIEKPKDAEKPKPNGPPPAAKPAEKPKEAPKPAEKPKEGPKPDAPKNAEPVAKPAQQMKGPEPIPVGVPSVFPYVGPSYDGYATGPYYHGYGAPPPPQPCYEGYYGYGNGYGRDVHHANRPVNYYNEDDPQGCSIM